MNSVEKNHNIFLEKISFAQVLHMSNTFSENPTHPTPELLSPCRKTKNRLIERLLKCPLCSNRYEYFLSLCFINKLSTTKGYLQAKVDLGKIIGRKQGRQMGGRGSTPNAGKTILFAPSPQ